jgi:hypothetical protein
MHNAIVFDALAFSKKLKNSGFTEQQAESLALAQTELVNDQLVNQQHLDLRLAELKNDLVKWMLGVAGIQMAIILATTKLFSS